MKQDNFDRILMEEMTHLPPQAPDVAAANPWQTAMNRILWGMALNTFQFEFFYLQYILPLLGSVLMYLGFRSLRKENRWFRLCWVITAVTLVWHALWDVLAASPLPQRVDNSPFAVPLIVGSAALSFARLIFLRAGIRTAFAATGEAKPKDWLGRGVLAHLCSYGIAVWSTLVPLTEPGAFFGPQIIDKWRWLYYGRSFAFIALEIFLLVCIAKQSGALEGRGYTITPAPVKCSAPTVLVAVFAAVLLAIPPVTYLSCRIPMSSEPAQQISTVEQEMTRRNLITLGLPEGLADILSPEELDACAGATAVFEPLYIDMMIRGEERDDQKNFAAKRLGDLELQLSSWMVSIPGQKLRQYQWFEYTALPEVRLQEQFSIDPSGNYSQSDFGARLVWTQEGIPYACTPTVQVTGGLTEAEIEEIGWNSFMFPEAIHRELKQLGGRLHLQPWIDFSIPKEAETMQGYLAFTADVSSYHATDRTVSFHDHFYFALRHQTKLLHYPFHNIADLGGSANAAQYGPIEAIYGVCDFYPFEKFD